MYLAKSLIISFQYNIESVYFFYSNPVFDLQKYSYIFRLQPVAILRELHRSKSYTALLRDLSIVNGKIYKLMFLCYTVQCILLLLLLLKSY